MGTHQHHQKKLHVAKAAKPAWVAHDSSIVPPNVVVALRAAMKLEDIAPSDFDDLVWIVAQESEGKVDARNSHSTARGLFQLLHMQYGLNPHGAKSFGNATEEAQGGIRYIIGRYRTVQAARAFWESHHWY